MNEPVLHANLMGITDHALVTYGLKKFFFYTVSKATLQLTLHPIHFLVQWTLGVNSKKVKRPALEATMTSTRLTQNVGCNISKVTPSYFSL